MKQPIPKTKLPQAAARSQWRAWLERNHKSKLEKFAGLLAGLRIRVAYIGGARRRPAEFKKRLAHFIKRTEQNKQFGFGGIDKYF